MYSAEIAKAALDAAERRGRPAQSKIASASPAASVLPLLEEIVVRFPKAAAALADETLRPSARLYKMAALIEAEEAPRSAPAAGADVVKIARALRGLRGLTEATT